MSVGLTKYFTKVSLAESKNFLKSLTAAYGSRRTLSTKTAECNDDVTHFGYETVTKSEKTKRVSEVFSNVAEKYDLMNDVMSFGIHRFWKDKLLQVLNPDDRTILLDCAGGTGDIAFRFIRYVQATTSNRSPRVTVCDVNEDMLNVGRKRAEDQQFHLDWVCGSADDLPFPDQSFTAYTIAFGIRNCADVNQVLKEAYRVLSPGGRFLCLEFSQVSNSILKRIYDSYSFQVIPVMGEVIASDWKSYQYLVESIRKFPNQIEFKDMLTDNGFKAVSYENLNNGICAIHSGFKL